MDSFKKKSERKKKQIGSSQKSQAKSLAFFFALAPPLFPLLPLLSRPQKRTKHVVAVGTRLRGAKVVRERGPDVSVRACFVPMPLRHRLQTGAVALFLLRPRPRSLSPSLFLPPPSPPPPLRQTQKKNSAGAKAALWSSLAAGAALGLANHYSPAFKAALGPSGRAAMVALPALGVVFLEVEWKINACAMRQRHGGKPAAVEPDDILPKRSG